MFGEEKSTKALLTGGAGAHVSIPSISIFAILCILKKNYAKKKTRKWVYKYALQQEHLTLAIHLVDSTTLTNPGPVTEQEIESTISEVGKLFKRAYVKKKKKKEQNKS